MRDDFSVDVKDTMAKRVGMKCSNPNCRKPTSGPQVDPEKSINVGVAAHIKAASPGGKRYDASMSSDERKSISNGLWLCQVCAKLVDNDEARYTVDLLHKWKQVSELAALLDVETNQGVSDSVEITSVISINQSGGQTAKTIVNHRPVRRSFAPHKEIITFWLKKAPPYPYDIHILMNDMETSTLANELKAIFDEAGWTDGKIIKGLGGHYPPGITITRDKDSEQSDNVLEGIFRTGFKNVVGQEAFKGTKIGIYIGPNPDAFTE